jgi:DNA polymerase III delta subunit
VLPALSLDGLRKQVAAGRLDRLYLIVGDDVRLIEEAVAAIEGTVDPADQPFAVERLYAGEEHGSPGAVVNAAHMLPMLGDRRIVIVLRAEKFLKPKRAAKMEESSPAPADAEDGGDRSPGSSDPGTDLAILEDYVKKPVSSATVVFVAADIDRGRKLSKALVAGAQVVSFTGLEGDNAAERGEARQAAARQVREDFQRLGRTIDPKALRTLVERAGGDISKLRDDAERLALYTEGQTAISLADVDEVAAVATEVEDEWAVVNAIADGDAGRALRELTLRLDRGDNVHALVGQLRWWVSARLSESAPDRVKPAIDAVLRTDLALKGSGGDERVLVERLVVELTGRPIPKPAWRR